MNDHCFAIALFLLLLICVDAKAQNSSAQQGKILFERNCIRCHGKNGAKGFLGAKNLQKSGMEDQQLATIISNGKRIMPSWKDKLSADEIKVIIVYIKTFRNIKAN
jgi:cytochrome c6